MMSGQRRDDDMPTFSWTKQSRTDVYPEIDPASPPLSLEEKVVIVTGAGEGIGRLVSAEPSGLKVTV